MPNYSSDINYNRQLEDAIRNCFRRSKIDHIPVFYDPAQVMIVSDVNPYPTKFCQEAATGILITSGTSATVFTTPSDRDFFLNTLTLAFSKDATCDVASGSLLITVVVNGQTKNILRVPIVTLTLERDSVTLNLATPVKLDRGTAITLNASTFTTGIFSRIAGMTGFTCFNNAI